LIAKEDKLFKEKEAKKERINKINERIIRRIEKEE